jgi:hypothetical protein
VKSRNYRESRRKKKNERGKEETERQSIKLVEEQINSAESNRKLGERKPRAKRRASERRAKWIAKAE